MVKLLIVDDDEIICRGLAICIDWSLYDIEVVGIAFDGEVGLHSIENNRPDIILIDINMPFIDGLELSHIVRQKYPAIKIILLTAYTEFEYAKQAVKLQVFDYLSKPFENDEVVRAVLNAKNAIDSERKIRNEMSNNLGIIKGKYLSELMISNDMDDVHLNYCGLSDLQNEFCAACLYIENIFQTGQVGSDSIIDDEIARMLVLAKIKNYTEGFVGLHVFQRGDKIVLLFESKSLDYPSIKSMLAQVLEFVNANDDYFLSCGTGNIIRGADSIRYSYEQAHKAVSYHHYFSNQSLISMNDIESHETSFDEYLQLHRKKILQNIEDSDYLKLSDNMTTFLSGITEQKESVIKEIEFAVIEIIFAIIRKETIDNPTTDYFQDYIKNIVKLLGEKDLAKVQNLISDIIQPMNKKFFKQNSKSNELLVERAIEYIDKNYFDPDLSLKTVADYVHTNSSYLCVLIKQFNLISYIDYLNRIRMENAKILLQNNAIKTYEIAFDVGFNSSQYFASCFKKYTGLTPSEYREHIKEN